MKEAKTINVKSYAEATSGDRLELFIAGGKDVAAVNDFLLAGMENRDLDRQEEMWCAKMAEDESLLVEIDNISDSLNKKLFGNQEISITKRLDFLKSWFKCDSWQKIASQNS
jgi:hypothetical protein